MLTPKKGDGKEELREIASIGLKTVVAEIPPTSQAAKTSIRRLIPKLVALLAVIDYFFINFCSNV
jgi:hypothetical protein